MKEDKEHDKKIATIEKIIEMLKSLGYMEFKHEIGVMRKNLERLTVNTPEKKAGDEEKIQQVRRDKQKPKGNVSISKVDVNAGEEGKTKLPAGTIWWDNVGGRSSGLDRSGRMQSFATIWFIPPKVVKGKSGTFEPNKVHLIAIKQRARNKILASDSKSPSELPIMKKLKLA